MLKIYSRLCKNCKYNDWEGSCALHRGRHLNAITFTEEILKLIQFQLRHDLVKCIDLQQRRFKISENFVNTIRQQGMIKFSDSYFW